MTDAINNQNRLRSSPSSIEQKSPTAIQTKTTPASTNDSQTNTSAVVNISSSKILASMQAEVDKLPDIDQSKIDSIKQALADGSYQTNADTIAQKFIEIEKLL